MLPEGSAKQSEKGLWGRVLEYDLKALKKEKETCTEQSQDCVMLSVHKQPCNEGKARGNIESSL